MMDWILILGWGSPIGIGIFLVLLGSMIFLLAKADETSKRTKAFTKEKGIEKKSVLRETFGSSQK
jgi:hypothetical protein